MFEPCQKLLSLCGVESPAERSNIFRQTGDDCVWWVLHYAEVEARMEHGEGLGACLSIGHPLRKPQIRICLQKSTQQLEDARDKWLKQEEMHRTQAEAVRKLAEKKMGNIVHTRAELEKLRQRAAAAAEEMHRGSRDLSDPEVTVGRKKSSHLRPASRP